MDQLEESLYPKAVDEVNSLLVTAGALHDGNEGTTVGTADTPSLPPWDYPYLKRLALTDVSVDHIKLAEYFPINVVVLRMLDLLSDCLQMHFEKICHPQVWDPTVEAWEVWDKRPDQQEDFIGYLYMDLMFRENKHKGCQNVNLRPVSGASFSSFPLPAPSLAGCAIVVYRRDGHACVPCHVTHVQLPAFCHPRLRPS